MVEGGLLMPQAKIGVIGGSGLYDIEGLRKSAGNV